MGGKGKLFRINICMKQVKPINILIACDNNYAPYYGVLLVSLFRHHSGESFDVYLITDNSICKQTISKFSALCERNNSRFFVKVADVNILKDYPNNLNHHVNLAGYYHILAPAILPKDIDKIIYMDGDMLVRGNIEDLWEMDMEGYAMAAALDSIAFDKSVYERLGYCEIYPYVNNGVSVINLKYWRENQVIEKAMAYIAGHHDTLDLMDQDTENAVLYDKIKVMPITYNYQVMFLAKYFWKDFDDAFRQKVLDTAKHPIIIHYNGGIKPWSWRYWKLPYRMEWLREYWKSPWWFAYQIKPIGKYIKHLIKRIVRRKNTIAAQQSQYIPEANNL